MSSNPALQVKEMSVSFLGHLLPLSFIPLGSFKNLCLHRPSLNRQGSRDWRVQRKLDLTDTIKDGARLFLIDEGIRRQLLLALTEDSKLHIQEVCRSENCCFIFFYGHNTWFTRMLNYQCVFYSSWMSIGCLKTI